MGRKEFFYDVVFSRRSIRRYAPQAIPESTLERILTAAMWAPSAHNRQPWRFVLVSGVQQKRDLAKAMGRRLRRDLQADGLPEDAIEKDTQRSFERISSAPALILICLSMEDMDSYPDQERQRNEWIMATQSAAMAGQNLLLAAEAEGLGACWMCAPLFCTDVVRETLALPAGWQPQGLITLGHAAESREKTRFPLSSRLYRPADPNPSGT